jgi:hypothetical protein
MITIFNYLIMKNSAKIQVGVEKILIDINPGPSVQN